MLKFLLERRNLFDFIFIAWGVLFLHSLVIPTVKAIIVRFSFEEILVLLVVKRDR